MTARTQMPPSWQSEHPLFPHQVGFTYPPFDVDASPSVFLRIAPRSVGVRGWMLYNRYDQHGLDQRKSSLGMLDARKSLVIRP